MKSSYYMIAVLWLLGCAGIAAAHPLGNFSVNQYSRIEVGESEIKIRQVLDFAEIPTFQEKARIDLDKDGRLSDSELKDYAALITPGYLANLLLSINGIPVELRGGATVAQTEIGEGNLPILKIKWDLKADLPETLARNQVKFDNKNYRDRIGWNEIVVNQIGGVAVFDSTAYGNQVTDELKLFPEESLSVPLSERAGEFSFGAGPTPANAAPLRDRDGTRAAVIQKDRLAELISVPEITPAIAFFGLLLALGLGAIHALSPGHGKAIVGAYLVGSRGTPKHAAFLGLTVTITHTIGVFGLGILTLFASNYIFPETLMPFLSFFSGLIVLYIGLTMFKSRLFSLLGVDSTGHGHSHGSSPHSHHDHSHEHSHGHSGLTHTHDGHTHSHEIPDKITWKNLLALGVSGGLLPCPSALVLMLSAINLNRIGYGLILTIAFSVGLAGTLTVVGLAFLYGGRIFDGAKLSQNRLVKALPVFSAFVISILGAVICYNSIP
ncbi:MAG: nickel/cobalt transporter [Pyrinomonadaceae bacterium]